jgi:hypothetical protein
VAGRLLFIDEQQAIVVAIVRLQPLLDDAAKMLGADTLKLGPIFISGHGRNSHESAVETKWSKREGGQPPGCSSLKTLPMTCKLQ